MATNVESQLWFCLESPLGWSLVGTPLYFAFLYGFASFGATMVKKKKITVFNFTL